LSSCRQSDHEPRSSWRVDQVVQVDRERVEQILDQLGSGLRRRANIDDGVVGGRLERPDRVEGSACIR
jgi:hypothetical protein